MNKSNPLPDGRMMLRCTVKPGELTEEEAIASALEEIVQDFDPEGGFRIHHGSFHADYRTCEDGVERRRGNRYQLSVVMERNPGRPPE